MSSGNKTKKISSMLKEPAEKQKKIKKQSEFTEFKFFKEACLKNKGEDIKINKDKIIKDLLLILQLKSTTSTTFPLNFKLSIDNDQDCNIASPNANSIQLNEDDEKKIEKLNYSTNSSEEEGHKTGFSVFKNSRVNNIEESPALTTASSTFGLKKTDNKKFSSLTPSTPSNNKISILRDVIFTGILNNLDSIKKNTLTSLIKSKNKLNNNQIFTKLLTTSWKEKINCFKFKMFISIVLQLTMKYKSENSLPNRLILSYITRHSLPMEKILAENIKIQMPNPLIVV